MKSILVIGDLNDKLKRVLDKCVSDKVISHYVNYEMYNEAHQKANEEMHLTNTTLSNEEFCEMFISTTKLDQEEWIIMKGDIHTKEFLKILIGFEKRLTNYTDIFLSHIVQLVNKDKNGPKSFYLTDGALNVKQINDSKVLANIIRNAQLFIIDKKQGINKVDSQISTAIILAADNDKVPGYEAVNNVILWNEDIPDRDHLEIKQFDECFSADAWCIKHKEVDTMMFTYPDLLVTPDITVGNAIWKSLSILNNWYAKGYVIGGKLTTVLLSRSDSEESYYESIKGVCNEN